MGEGGGDGRSLFVFGFVSDSHCSLSLASSRSLLMKVMTFSTNSTASQRTELSEKVRKQELERLSFPFSFTSLLNERKRADKLNELNSFSILHCDTAIKA